MIEGENLALALSVSGFDLSQCKVIAVLQGKTRRIEKTNDDMQIDGAAAGTRITLQLSQEDTLMLGMGTVTIQVNWIDVNGLRRATRKASFNMEENLYKKVMEFEDE